MNESDDYRIVFDQDGGADAQLVRDRLDMFNVGVTGLSAYYPVNLFVKNTRGETMGGLLGGIWGGWLYISYLWVDEAVRGQRWATKLMDQAEAYAVERRCRLGDSFADALADTGRAVPALRALTDGLLVAERSGAPIADLLGRLADDARATVRRRAEAHARRVPVRLLFPLVFLVLPAFGLLTVVPALASGLRSS